MVKRLTMVFALVLIWATLSQAADWMVDPDHSFVTFEVRHLVISKARGQFGDFTATVSFDEANLEKGSVEMVVQTKSIDTDNADRDKHLSSPEFLDVENHPTMTFKSKKIARGEGNSFEIRGDLTIRGVTKEVTFECEFHGIAKDPWGNTKAGFSATTTINRQDFNVSWSKKLDTGGLVVGDDVKINLELEFKQAS